MRKLAGITEIVIQATISEVAIVSTMKGRVTRCGATPAAFITISSESPLSLFSV